VSEPESDPNSLPPDGDPVVRAVDSAEARRGAPSNGALAWEPCNDWGNARRLIARKGDDLLWSPKRGWLVWDGKRYNGEDGDVLVQLAAQEVAAQVALEADALQDEAAEDFKGRITHLRKWCTQSGNSQRLSAMANVAAPHLLTCLDDLDSDNWKVNAANCVLHVDPKTAAITPYPHRRGDRMTHLLKAEYRPEAAADAWLEFIDTVLPETDTAIWVQKWSGYWLVGCTAEQKMAMFQGRGSNGKSTLIETIAEAVMGDYEATAPIATFLHNDNRSGGEGPTPSIARLPGVRMLRTSEPDPGARLGEGMIKKITGGERQEARELNKSFFEFKPQLKLTMSVNQLPAVVGKDMGIRRRIVVVPFTQDFKPEKGFHDKLLAEGPGILNWMLDGLRLYLEEGLDMPEAIENATHLYFTEMDPIGQFLKDAIDPQSQPGDSEGATTLWKAYQQWCSENNEDPRTQTQFGRRLNDLGYRVKRVRGLKQRCGLKLVAEYAHAGLAGSDD